ncbi:hypothetical protein XYCOK13_14430 [Xylanibacillus composti]|uniref:Uncharacterized protein n=1 Tax=Xylanibacillus composti TaxID=1572762 RepID=A0A8J4H493_9BACL|nr:hypothetical protein [Xylanibacillus composti]GIQ68619.1 hypothetical protein XYCOK13_14430 [Xylanibacillus composti]
MHGTIRWNFAFGGAGAVLTLLISMPHNVWFTAMTRSVYAFVIFFLLTFLIRWWLGFIAAAANAAAAADGEAHYSGVGRQIDLQTPEEAEFPPASRQSEGGSGQSEGEDPFQPLNPPKLVSKPEQTPAEMANAVRRMTEE